MDAPTIPFPAWTREVGYPQYSRTDGALAVNDRYYVQTSLFSSNDLATIEGRSFLDLVLRSSSAAPDGSGKMTYINVSYSRPDPGGSILADARPMFTLDDGGQEIGIDRKKADGSYILSGYLVKWNYHLIGAKSAATPEWWATATELDEAVSPYRWAKEPDCLRDGEEIIQGKTKNAESYLSPSPVVIEERRYRSYNTASESASVVGERKTPEKTFGLTQVWLVVGCSIRPEGRRWIVTTRYQGADAWDTDLYSEAVE